MDSDFENLLEECVSDLPPVDVVNGVTPWKNAMNRILWGMALTTITFEFWNLDYYNSHSRNPDINVNDYGC